MKKLLSLLVVVLFLGVSVFTLRHTFSMTTSGSTQSAQSIESLLAIIKSLQAQIAALTAQKAGQVTSSTNSGQATYTFTTDLSLGSRGTDVSNLQTFLKSQGYFTGDVTGYFGPATQVSLASYQR